MGTPSIQCNTGTMLGYQCKLNLDICMVSDYKTNPWSTNIKLDNFKSLLQKLNYQSTRLGALLPFTWDIDTQTASSSDKPTVSTLHVKFIHIMRCWKLLALLDRYGISLLHSISLTGFFGGRGSGIAKIDGKLYYISPRLHTTRDSISRTCSNLDKFYLYCVQTQVQTAPVAI